ncbi:MAG: B12-binding domain-containing radical SAM protein [Magnetococcus sp. DMHC-6]
MIFLINPPFLDVHSTYAVEFKREPYANPALALLAAVLFDLKIPYQLVDAKLEEMTTEALIQRMQKSLGDNRPTLIGLTNSNTTEFANDLKTVALLRQQFPGVPLVMGGPHVSALPERSLAEGPLIDVLCIFEGKDTLVDLYQHFVNGGSVHDLGHIPGIAFRNQEGQYVRTENRKKDRTRWADVGLSRWEDFHGKAATWYIFTTIGCPYRCSYCFNATDFNVSFRNPEVILQELRYVIHERGAREFFFADPTFAVNRKHTVHLLEQMIAAGLHTGIKWKTMTRVNAIDAELLDLMRRAGCYEIALGVESTQEHVLKRANKKTNRDMIDRAVSLVKAAKINCKAFLIFGHIGETEADIRATIRHVVQLNPTDVVVGVMVPWPGTEIYELALNRKEGFELLSQEFDKYDKHFGMAMKNNLIDMRILENLRVEMYLRLYVQNGRFGDFLKFIWTFRRAVVFKIWSLLMGSNRQTSSK